jgi:hypothetical protein
VAGADTWRGVDFQAALATARALDVLEGQLGDSLDVDCGAEIADYSSQRADRLLLVGQAKTRAQPNTWAPADLTEVIRRLIAVPATENASLEFVTDGSLSRESASTLLPTLDRVRDDEATDQDWTYLAGHHLTAADADALKRFSLITRHDSTNAVLNLAVRRVRTLADLQAAVTDEEAELRVLRLLRRIGEHGSSSEEKASRLTRADVGEIVGVQPDVIDRARPWSEELSQAYRQTITDEPGLSAVVELDAELQALPTVESVEFGAAADGEDQRARQAVLDLLDRDCLITGPAGAGKTRSLQMLQLRAAEEGLIPVLLSPRTYEKGALAAAVRDAVTRRLGFVVAPATGAILLARQETVLLIDGVSELAEPEMRRLLARDIDDVRGRLVAATVIVSGRSVGGLRPLDLPAYRLVELNRESRREMATELLGQEAGPIVAAIEAALGEAVGNPLLFAMALKLGANGTNAETVGALYEAFVDHLAERSQLGQEIETPLGVVGGVCADLVEQGRFSLDRWTWLQAMESKIDALRGRGLVGGDLAAVDMLNILERIGLLVADADQSGFSLLHDSFRDWLAARALAIGLAAQPSAFGAQWAAVAAQLAETGQFDRAFLKACTADLAVASAAAMRELSPDFDNIDELTTDLLHSLLVEHLGDRHAAAWSGTRIVTRDTDQGKAAYLLPAEARDEDLAAAIAGAQFGHDVGPLRIAVSLVHDRIRRALRTPSGWPAPVPHDAQGLARAVEQHFVARRQALTRQAEEIVPTLAERVDEHLGWRGLSGCIAATSDEDHMDHHLLRYTFDVAGVTVKVGTDGLAEATRTMGAEDFVRESPEQAAADALSGAVAVLLVGFAARP